MNAIVLRRRILCFKPFEDEVRFIDWFAFVWYQDRKLFKRVEFRCLRGAVPRNFRLQIESNTFLC